MTTKLSRYKPLISYYRISHVPSLPRLSASSQPPAFARVNYTLGRLGRVPSDITNFDSVGHDRYHVVAKYKVDKWTPIVGDPGAVSFHHEHFIVPANCPPGSPRMVDPIPSIKTFKLCISQFHLRPAPPPPGCCGAFARLVSPGGGAFANVALPGGRAFANPRAIPEVLTRTRFPIRI